MQLPMPLSHFQLSKENKFSSISKKKGKKKIRVAEAEKKQIKLALLEKLTETRLCGSETKIGSQEKFPLLVFQSGDESRVF